MPIKQDRYAVFGNPVGHSLSPRIHALFAAQTQQAMRYEAICPPLDGFADAVRDFIAAGGRGANVTLPFKEAAYRLADELTPRAAAAGAVNTLSFTDGKIHGDNTDGAGLVRDITVNLGRDLRAARIVILGAGGAARGAILPLLAMQPAALVIANRTAAKAARLAAEFGNVGQSNADQSNAVQITGGGFDLLAGQTFDVAVDATSAGLAAAEDAATAVLPAPTFSAQGLAYEMVYGRDTPFMRAARAAGVQAVDGLGMLVEQAAEAFFVWRGVRPDTAPVLTTLRATLRPALPT
jgi:shikimate dehydrogenase